MRFSLRADTLMFNPQPEPPAQDDVIALDHLVFNPQPEPPPQGIVSDLEARGFNPQPEPPAVIDLEQSWDIF